VVAKSGIPSGKAISADDIALDWTPYQRGAFENEEPVKGKVATKAIRAGDVILGDFIAGSGQVSTGK
jgi:Flp pilus assembly protein CpaB